MRRALFALALGLATAGAAQAASCPQPQGASGLAAQATDLVNDQRRANGRSQFGADQRLTRAAQAHACWIATTGKYGHYGPNNSTPKVRVKSQGYRSCLTAENIAWGQTSAAQVVSEWMNSQKHRTNILNKGLESFGLGVAEMKGRPVWVLVFAKPC